MRRSGDRLWISAGADTLDGMEILENVPLAPYTTFKIGGPARWFAEAASEANILEAVSFARERGLPLFVLGGGSNLLVSDAGFAGLVLRIALRGIREHFDDDTLVLQAEAGEDWDKLVSHAVSLDCAGIECLAGIPGTVGGTPVQNVGAYGQEVFRDDRCGSSFRPRVGEVCGDERRRSADSLTGRASSTPRRRAQFIVTRVDYALTAGGPPTLTYADLQRHFQGASESPSLAQVAEAVRAIRRSKGMFLVEGDPDCASAGSFFKNPVVDVAALARIEAAVPAGTKIPQYPAPDGKVKLAAAWLVEQAGFSKGYGNGRAGISSRHTLALVNRGGATAADVLALSEEIAARVEEKFGVRLEREPVLVQ